MADLEEINCEDLEKKASEEYKDKLEFIKGIKNQINPILIEKIKFYFNLIMESFYLRY